MKTIWFYFWMGISIVFAALMYVFLIAVKILTSIIYGGIFYPIMVLSTFFEVIASMRFKKMFIELKYVGILFKNLIVDAWK